MPWGHRRFGYDWPPEKPRLTFGDIALRTILWVLAAYILVWAWRTV